MTRAHMLPIMLSAASSMPEFTARTLAERIGVPQKHVADMLGLYHRRGSRQFRRLRKDGRYWVYTTLSEAEYAPIQRDREAAARREHWLAEEEKRQKKREAARKAQAAKTKAKEEEWKKDREAKNAERRARVEAILAPYQGFALRTQKQLYAYIGERLNIRIPAYECDQYQWRTMRTRFAVFTEPGRIVFRNASEDHSTDEITLTSSRRVSLPVRVCETADWKYGDVISVECVDREIVLEKVTKQ